MKSDYKKAVGIFGIAIPVIIMLGLALAGVMKASSIHSQYEAKVRLQKKDKMGRMQNAVLEKKVKAQKQELEAWKKLLAQEDRRTFLKHWLVVRKKFKPAEFLGDRPVWSNKSSGLGAGVKTPSSEASMSFDATYRAMQLAFLEVETILPQMQLDSLTMSPNKDGKTIHVQTKYTVWNH